ncbi:MAG TPA: hypothetical protein VLG25_03020, partial [Patescibacteria group bacterium]|nr:hypothetical protein [Patescibacteria group bacterium]
PYHTSVTEKDLEFSQGDLNVDLVIALGVIQRDDMDQAITAHGRILHDAVVASINTKPSGELGSINWVDERASSLSEMITGLSDMVKVGLLDGQIATDLLTGIVSETERFSNSKTTSETMAMSSKLMAAGANQQLVATKMQDNPPETPPSPPSRPPAPLPPPAPKPPKEPTGPEVKTLARDEKKDGEVKIDQTRPGESGQIDIDDQGTLKVVASPSLPVAQQEEKPGEESESSRPLVTSPPTLGGKLTANTESEHLDPSTDPFSQKPSNAPLLSREPKEPEASLPAPMSPLSPAPVSMPSSTAPDSSQQEPESTNDIKLPDSLEEARKAVEQAAAATPAQPDTTPVAPADVTELANPPYKHSLIPQDKGLPADNTASPNSNAAPPPVPPPMMPPAFGQPKADESQDGLIPGVPL